MENKENTKCSEKSCRCGASSWTAPTLLVLVFLAAHAIAFPFAANFIAEKTANRILLNEYAKVGGKETYDTWTEAQAIQLKSSLAEMRSFIEQSKAGTGSKDDTKAQQPNQQATPDAKTGNVISKDEITSILKNSYAEGKATARFLVVEYSDFECPFCIRQYKDGVMKQISAKFGDDVRHIFKPFRAVPHPGAEPKAVASLCVGQLGGADIYAKYYAAIFDGSEMQNKVYPVSDLAKLAASIGVNETKFNACYNAKQTVALYDAYTSEGQKYGVEGTPGTLIIDTKTGKSAFVPGAYPVGTFINAIDAMKNAN